jgi:hypothetical protein
MSSERQSSSGIPVSALKETVGIFSLLGVGLGLTGGITMSQLGGGGGGGFGGAIIGGILILVVLTFAFLIGPLVAVITGLRTGQEHGQSVQTYIAGGLGAVGGYFSMMLIVLLILSIVMSTLSGDAGTGSSATQTASASSSGLDIGQYIVPVIAVAIPTGITGLGGVFFANNGQRQAREASVDPTSEGQEGAVKSDSAFDSIPVKKIGIAVAVVAVIGVGVAILPGIISSLGGDSGSSGTASVDSPEAAVEQYRTASIEGNAEAFNELLFEGGGIPQAGSDFESVDIEVIESDINEVSVSEYESQTGQTFDEESIQNELSQAGGIDYAIVRWNEKFVSPEGEEDSFDQYFTLYKIDGEWLMAYRYSGN